ncbi:MAG: DUF3298 domain-containing protein [Niameybacter sp.]
MNKNLSDQENKLTQQLDTTLHTIEIPSELDSVVQAAIKKGSASKRKVIRMKKWSRTLTTTAAVLMIGFVGAANISPTFAKTMSTIPVLNTLINVVTFNQFDYHEETYAAQLETPALEGLQNTTLQDTLNTKYLKENKALFDQFQEEVAQMKQTTEGGHLGINTGYTIKTNNDHILSIGRSVVNTVGSSSTTITYDTIDKQNELLITLPSLFKDASYVDVISENILVQMRTRMIEDANQFYWIDADAEFTDIFTSIDAEQNFYISDTGKLIISFDKYQVGPGSMGVQEFEIPTELLQPLLVSNTYIH